MNSPSSPRSAVGESHRHATILSAVRQIPSLRHNHFIGLANPIAKPQSFQSAGDSIVAPQSFQRSGESHHRATIISAGQQTQSFQQASASHRQAAKSHLGRCNIVVLPFYLGRRIIVVPSYRI